MTLPKKNDPLTPEEVSEATEDFFKLFYTVMAEAPSHASVADVIKLSDRVFAHAHQLRAIDAQENSLIEENEYFRAVSKAYQRGSDV